MSLRILFADDSMTAQNMGKKILTDAGYDVVAVSNGAAAVKKIAEHKPDIIILDVYMPGYSGLEVCEKVRASIETLKTPVLLTVGKMEPYKPEDASRVRADGVIIKPFEASDLLAIVKKLEERVVRRPPPMAEQTILLERPPDFSQFEHHEEPHREETTTGSMQPYVDVPDHMAGSSAFSDMLGIEHAPEHDPAVNTAPPAIDLSMREFSTQPTSVPLADHEPEPEPLGAVAEQEPEAPPSAPYVAASVPEVVPIPPVPEEPEPLAIPSVPEPPPMMAVPEITPSPTYQGPALVVQEAEPVVAKEVPLEARPSFEPPPPPPIEADHELEPGLMPTAYQPHGPEIPAGTDPALLPGGDALRSFPTRFGVNNPEHVPVGVAAEVPEVAAAIVDTPPAHHPAPLHLEPVRVDQTPPEPVAAAPVAEVPPVAATAAPPQAVPEDDFEARVARAMSAFEQSTAEPVVEPRVAASAPAPPVLEPAAPPSFEYVPGGRTPEPVVAASSPAAPVEAPVGRLEPETHARPVLVHNAAAEAPAVEEPQPPAVEHVQPEKISAKVEQQLPAAAAAVAAAATGAGADDHLVAEMVHRVMERLKPDLIEQIVRELKDRK